MAKEKFERTKPHVNIQNLRALKVMVNLFPSMRLTRRPRKENVVLPSLPLMLSTKLKVAIMPTLIARAMLTILKT